MRSPRDPYDAPAGVPPAWELVVGGLLFAAATFGFLWAVPIILWALEGGW